jgi:Predicted signal transduction protein with a C-terminal ATPase domain
MRQWFRWKNLSFYKKLMLLYCILITLLVGCFYTASYFVSRASLDERTKTYMNHIGDLTSLKIWQSFDELDTTIQRTIFDMYLTELLSNYNEKDAKERDTALSYLAGKVNQLVSLNPYVEAVDFYFYNGDLFITPSSRQIPDIFNSPYFWINNLNQKLEWIELDADGQTINGSKIVMDSKGRAIAVMVVKVNHRFLADQMTNLTDQFTFYLTDAQGTIIFTSSAEPGIIGTTWQNAPKSGIIRTARQVTVLHWMLYLETPSITFSAYVNQYGKSQIILTVVIVILGVITSLAMALSISRPIKRLTRQMRRIAAEDPDLSAPPALGDEIAFLEHSFYSMVKRIDSLINNVYNEKILRRESELKALQAQINPHFLFNALDLLNWKALRARQEEISDIVQSLARLMEANLSEGEKTVPISREISYIRDYFKIMSKKFGDRIQLITDIEPAALDWKIPRLLLQPLVENSIRHGFQYIESGLIRIRIAASDDRLTVVIEDNGQGMPRERLESLRFMLKEQKYPALLSKFPHRSLEEAERESVGILNIIRRVRILYGDGARLDIDSTEGQGTTLIMELPKEEKS